MLCVYVAVAVAALQRRQHDVAESIHIGQVDVQPAQMDEAEKVARSPHTEGAENGTGAWRL